MKIRPVLIALLVTGCAHQTSYRDQIAAMPIPADDDGRNRTCSWLRQEIARQESLSAASQPSQYSVMFQAMARSNIAALEQKASEVPCNAAFGAVRTNPHIEPTIDQCVADCQRITGQDLPACFSTCKK